MGAGGVKAMIMAMERKGAGLAATVRVVPAAAAGGTVDLTAAEAEVAAFDLVVTVPAFADCGAAEEAVRAAVFRLAHDLAEAAGERGALV